VSKNAPKRTQSDNAVASAVDKITLGVDALAAEDKSVQFLNDHVNDGEIAE